MDDVTRARKVAVRALFSETIEQDLAAIPAEVYADPAIRPFVDALRAGLDGLAVPAPASAEPSAVAPSA